MIKILFEDEDKVGGEGSGKDISELMEVGQLKEIIINKKEFLCCFDNLAFNN